MKIKRINKTYIVTAVLVSVTVLFCGCGMDKMEEVKIETTGAGEESSTDMSLVIDNDIKKESQNENITNENNTEDHQEVLSTDIYDHVLAEYSDMVQNDFYMDLRDSDTYESNFGENIGLEIRTHKQDIYYTFYDIDGNGTMELVIAGGENSVSNPNFSPWNYDLYGYDGTNVVHIFPEINFGYRTNFSLYENGVIEVLYSSSAAEYGIDFYKIGNDGFTPELIDSFATVAHLENDSPVFTYFQNGDEITEDEYNTKVQNYEVPLTTILDWIQIQ